MPIVLPKPAASLGRGSSTALVPGTGTSVPSGVDGIILYNELTMNNRSWYDTIVITKIDGMADADIRDEREINPQRDGETSFDSFYSGRTLVLTGFIRAFSLEKLKDIEQALKTAFLTLEEKPMIFQGPTFETTSQIWCKKNAPIVWSNEYNRDDMFVRDFMLTVRASMPAFVSLGTESLFKNIGVADRFLSDSISSGTYEFLAGEGTLKVEEEQLAPLTTANKILGRSDIIVDYPQPLISVEYKPTLFFATSKVGAILKLIDMNNYIWAYIDNIGVPHIGKVDEGVSTEFMPFVTELSESPISRTLGLSYKAQFEMRDGKIFIKHGKKGEAFNYSFSFELGFPDFSKFGTEVKGFPYLDITPGWTTWRYDNIVFSASKLDEEEVDQIVNAGNYEAMPVISIRGPITDPVVTNLSTGEALRFEPGTTIDAGDFLDIDIAAGTLLDKNENNKFNLLSPSSDWPIIAPGSNSIGLTGTSVGGSVVSDIEFVTGLTIQMRHSWM